MSATFTTAQIAELLNTTPRELRKFLRADARTNNSDTPGKGGRYALKGDKRTIAAMKTKFAKWEVAQAEAAEARKAAKAVEEDAVRDAVTEDVDDEPTESDLEDIDAE